MHQVGTLVLVTSRIHVYSYTIYTAVVAAGAHPSVADSKQCDDKIAMSPVQERELIGVGREITSRLKNSSSAGQIGNERTERRRSYVIVSQSVSQSVSRWRPCLRRQVVSYVNIPLIRVVVESTYCVHSVSYPF